MANVARTWVYPIKSLDGVAVAEATVLPSGPLRHDRRYALLDDHSEFVTAKRETKVHGLRATFQDDFETVLFRVEGAQRARSFEIASERDALSEWLSDYFGYRVSLVENTELGYPDDPEAPGPTFVASSTLEEVASWFPGMSAEDARARFRVNVEIDDAEPFWEDRLVPETGQTVAFRIGNVEFEGLKPCARCVVPTRDPHSGERLADFTKTFVRQREASLPSWAARARFDHFYRLTVNTRASQSTCERPIRVGDEVRVIEANDA